MSVALDVPGGLGLGAPNLRYLFVVRASFVAHQVGIESGWDTGNSTLMRRLAVRVAAAA